MLSRIKPGRLLFTGALLLATIAGAWLWYVVAGVLEADAIPEQEARANAQLSIATVGSVMLLASNLLAWLGRWRLWVAAQALCGALVIVWIVLAEPLGL